MDPIKAFKTECAERIRRQSGSTKLAQASRAFLSESIQSRYSYNFSWMGRPIIQYPQDMVVMQEILWAVQPDLVIETGIAHGGSLIFYASILELIGKGMVLGIDIDIRSHNRDAILAHPMVHRIQMLQGGSTDPEIVEQVRAAAEGMQTVMVCLDSNHTHAHVLAELEAYSALVTPGSYLVVFDTIIEDLPDEFYPDRPWGRGNNPKTAVWAFLADHPEFVSDDTIEMKTLITVAPGGFLKRVS